MPDITAPATERVLHRALAPLDASVTRSGEPGNDTLTLSGYAAVTDVATTLYEGRAWVWREKIAPGRSPTSSTGSAPVTPRTPSC